MQDVLALEHRLELCVLHRSGMTVTSCLWLGAKPAVLIQRKAKLGWPGAREVGGHLVLPIGPLVGAPRAIALSICVHCHLGTKRSAHPQAHPESYLYVFWCSLAAVPQQAVQLESAEGGVTNQPAGVCGGEARPAGWLMHSCLLALRLAFLLAWHVDMPKAICPIAQRLMGRPPLHLCCRAVFGPRCADVCTLALIPTRSNTCAQQSSPASAPFFPSLRPQAVQREGDLQVAARVLYPSECPPLPAAQPPTAVPAAKQAGAGDSAARSASTSLGDPAPMTPASSLLLSGGGGAAAAAGGEDGAGGGSGDVPAADDAEEEEEEGELPDEAEEGEEEEEEEGEEGDGEGSEGAAGAAMATDAAAPIPPSQ